MVRVTLNGQRDLGEALVFAGVAARRSDQAWDWCGTPDFIADGGPQFASGPQRNARFMDWMAKAEAQRMSHQVANSFLGAEAVQAEFYAF